MITIRLEILTLLVLFEGGISFFVTMLINRKRWLQLQKENSRLGEKMMRQDFEILKLNSIISQQKEIIKQKEHQKAH